MKPRDPIENGTTGGTGPLNIEAAYINTHELLAYQVKQICGLGEVNPYIILT